MRRGKKSISMIAVLLGVLVVCGPVFAVEVIEEGYVVEIFSSISRPGIAVTRIMTFAGDGNLYVVQKADGSIWRVTPDGTASEFVNGLKLPAGITWAGGTSYGDYLYVGADRRLVRIGLDGTTSTFCSALRSISGVAVDRTGNYDGFLYATTAGTDRIYRVSGSGSASTFSGFLGSGSGGGPVGIVFDDAGDYGNLMFIPATWSSTPSKSGFFTVDTSGVATKFTDDLAKSFRVALDDTGYFSGHLFVLAADEFDGASALWRVRPDGTAVQFTEGHVSCLAFGPDGAMYVAEYDADSETVIISRISVGTLIGLEIVGPNEVAEDFTAQYKAVAHYDNGGTRDVTASAEWSVDDEIIASIAAGLLTTEIVDLPQDITITAEYSEGENTQEAQRQVSIFAICPRGSSLDFDGLDDYIEVPDNDGSLDITDSLTISAWVNLNNIEPDNFIASKQPSGTWRNNYPGNYEFRIREGNLRLGHQTGTGGLEYSFYFSTSGIEAGTWHHVAVTLVEGGDVNFYINGSPAGTSPQSGTFGVVNDEPVRIGTRKDVWSYLDGLTDDIRIYNRALCAEEIQAIIHTKPAGDDPNLVGYWDFDEGEGQVAGDSSLYGNDGQLGSGPVEDDSDPSWVESDAPIGICTAKGLVERNLLRVFDMKETILEIFEDALATENATKEFLDELFEGGEMGELKKGDVAKAKQKIHSAIQEEEQAESTVERSIDKLEDALDALDIE